AVLADPPHPLRVEAAQGHRVHRLPAELAHVLVFEALVLAVEAALELGPRATLELQPARRLPDQAGQEVGPLAERLRLEAHPDEVLDDVGLDQGAVDVEHGQHVASPGALADGLEADVAGLRRRGAPGRLLALANPGLGP